MILSVSSPNIPVLIAGTDHFNLLRIIRGEIRMENIMHPKAGIDVRFILDNLPYDMVLALPIHKAEEIAADPFPLP